MKGILTCEDQDCLHFITIYRFSGNQGLFRIPDKWCKECDVLVSLVRKTVFELGLEKRVCLIIKPWFSWWWEPLLKHFAWHAPILVIDGKVISQGIVPDKKKLINALS